MKIKALRIKQVLCVLALTVLSVVAQAKVVSFTKDNDGITFKLDKGLMKVKVCSDNIIEVKYTVLQDFLMKKSLVITNDWKKGTKFTLSENKEEIVIITGNLKVWINKSTNAIRFTDLKGSTILSEDGENGKNMTPAVIAGLQVNNCTTQFLSPANEALFGLGCHPED